MAAKTLQIFDAHHLQPGIYELVENPGMEFDSNWNDLVSPIVNERSAEQAYGGANSRKFTIDTQYDGIRSDTFTTITGRTYFYSGWIYPDDYPYAYVICRKGDDSGWSALTFHLFLIQDSWNYISGVYVEAAGGSSAFIGFGSPTGVTDGSWFIDDVSVREAIVLSQAASLVVKDTLHRVQTYFPHITDNGGAHRNTTAVTYSEEAYLKCRHLHGYLIGTYTSDITDRGSKLKELVYILANIVVLGEGTTWNDQIPIPNTWDDANTSILTWNQIFDVEDAPIVQIDLLYGDTSPPTNRIKRMEILSAIVDARYYQVEITITDPTPGITAMVENTTMKFCS